MRYLFLLRGSAGCGKSTFIKENNLEAYTISPDSIRTLLQTPVLNAEGKFEITMKNDSKVWKMVHEIMESKMERGETIIVDATHYRKALLTQYKHLIHDYRYRAFIIDFTDIPLEETLKRNAQRDEYKRVPESAIRKMYACFENDDETNNKFKIITREKFLSMLKEDMSIDFNKYKKIYIIGDVHGCLEPVKKFFETHDITDPENIYIFCGDYIDRGLQNKETIEFLLETATKYNVLTLEGNHEKWLKLYADNEEEKIRSKEFINNTLPEIQQISRKDLRRFYYKLIQMAFFKFRGKTIFISHGGIPIEPNIFVSTEQLIKGTGRYEDIDLLYENWLKNTKETILVHGHRNNELIPAKVNDRIYNICSDIEYGGNLRVLEIDGSDKNKEPVFNVIEIQNTLFKAKKEATSKTTEIQDETAPETSDEKFVLELNKSSLIRRKDCGNGITSYNFTRTAFYNQKWNALTTKARGLFVKNNKVVARSYDKFFNIGEMPQTEMKELAKMVFPVAAYKKENGFLSIISAAGVFSKTTNESPHVDIIKKVAKDKIAKIQKYAEENNCSLVFECISKEDPHIIRYCDEHLYLLDIIDNDFKFKKKTYEELKKVAEELHLEYKQLNKTFNSWDELKNFINNCHVTFEGFVLEDSNGFMVKLKSPYYKFWKKIKKIKDLIAASRLEKISYVSEEEVRVIKFMKHLSDLQNYNITQIQEMYYQK